MMTIETTVQFPDKPPKVEQPKPGRPRGPRKKLGGPFLASLPPMQRKFVEQLYATPGIGQERALKLAGYKGNDVAAKKCAHRYMKYPAVQAAILELGGELYRAKLPKAIYALDAVMGDPTHRDHVKVLHGVLDRVGLHPVMESKQTVTHNINIDDMKAHLRVLLAKPALKALLPPEPPPIDTDFIEVAETDD